MAADLEKLKRARARAAADNNAEAVADLDNRIYEAQMKGVDNRPYQERLLSAAAKARADNNPEALRNIHAKLREENAKLLEQSKQAEADKLGPFARAAAAGLS